MGMCSRQERIQKDIDVVIQKCKAEKDCLFADFRYSDSTFTFTYIGGSKSLFRGAVPPSQGMSGYSALELLFAREPWVPPQPPFCYMQTSSTGFRMGTQIVSRLVGCSENAFPATVPCLLQLEEEQHMSFSVEQRSRSLTRESDVLSGCLKYTL
uniref:Protein mono-ADP-ribosyltransferase PARP8 n=1 Tax=Coturnix japonica TaxID=93934 RepID=A0A8C2TFJ6_COTJA